MAAVHAHQMLTGALGTYTLPGVVDTQTILKESQLPQGFQGSGKN